MLLCLTTSFACVHELNLAGIYTWYFDCFISCIKWCYSFLVRERKKERVLSHNHKLKLLCCLAMSQNPTCGTMWFMVGCTVIRPLSLSKFLQLKTKICSDQTRTDLCVRFVLVSLVLTVYLTTGMYNIFIFDNNFNFPFNLCSFISQIKMIYCKLWRRVYCVMFSIILATIQFNVP